MPAEPLPPTVRRKISAEDAVIAYLRGRSVPCPQCRHDLRDIPTAICPECGEPLTIEIGSQRGFFAWLIFAMAPGCYCGISAIIRWVFILQNITFYLALPWTDWAFEGFRFLSAGSVVLMYRKRDRILAWSTRRQAALAWSVWAANVAAFVLFTTWRL